MVEPAAVAMHAARISGIEPGDLVVVVGAGLIGNLAMQAARTLGSGTVAIADIVPERLELARRLGADIVVDSSRGDPATVLEEPRGAGPPTWSSRRWASRPRSTSRRRSRGRAGA